MSISTIFYVENCWSFSCSAQRFKVKLLKVYLVLYAYAQWKGLVLSVPSFYSTARSISLSDI